MRMSDLGLALLKQHEGLKLYVYDDFHPHREYDGGPVDGTLTIGYGHTASAENFIGQRITEEDATRLLEQDLGRFERGVRRLTADTPITQNQFDALVSFAYNVGLGALEQSTLLAKHLAGDFQGAENEFVRWVYSKGRVLPGLAARRDVERNLYAGRLS